MALALAPSHQEAWRHARCRILRPSARPLLTSQSAECPTRGGRQARKSGPCKGQGLLDEPLKRLNIDELKETDIHGATRILRISWVLPGTSSRRRLARHALLRDALPRRRREGHYLTLVCDLDRSTVKFLAEARQAGRLGELLHGLPNDQPAGINAIALDIVGALHPYPPHSRACRRDQDGLFDRYHIMTPGGPTCRNVNTGPAGGRGRPELYAEENLPGQHRERFAQLKDAMLNPAASGRPRRAGASSGTTPGVGWARHTGNGGRLLSLWRPRSLPSYPQLAGPHLRSRHCLLPPPPKKWACSSYRPANEISLVP